ncbi:MAG: DUF3108 domain-containing protein [Massilibacteroides sp.]|nr:DUF3108 domain-containing protein [Massilibacteroides sp.]MDD3062000.1 DUF3108 domain-containing protein [Massilibacteroides sp.]MDD4114055.1 DUF3108 domain-containing protein [Massilibacteroides sp.]MDD4659283.1 DUF3108 domain-containing protein [Massilibacteroides sp.]
MKENRTVRLQVVQGYPASDFKFGFFLIVCLLWSLQENVSAQCRFENKPFVTGENVDYVIYFKWGILMPKAGQASIDFYETNEDNMPGYSYRLLFRTTGLFESIYKMRDTLASFHDINMRLLRGIKNSNEGGYYSIDQLTFSYLNDNVSAHSLRYTPTHVKIDTTLTSEGCVFDLMSSVLYLRSLNFTGMTIGDRFSFQVMIGRDVVNVSFHYKGQAILERNNVKYKTRYFSMDIYDEVFEQNESAAEIWIGDDENRIPIKIRAKLKLGAGEAYYSTSSGLKYPLNCRIVISKNRK